MGEFYKDIQFSKLQKQKVLTLSENNILQASDVNIGNIASKDKVEAQLTTLTEKVSGLETEMGNTLTRLQNINGKTTV